MATFLVTGGAGFIGSHIATRLVAQGETVRVLDNLSTGYRHNMAAFGEKIEFVEGDIRSLDDCRRAVDGVDYVLHQAAVPSVPWSVEQPIENHEHNITGTLNLLVAARDAGVKRVVFASSSAVYGDIGDVIAQESMPIGPLSPYGAAKITGEHYLRVFSECYGLETVALRYFNVFGPRQDPGSQYSGVISLFITAMLKGKCPVVLGDGLQSRDFIYVENNVQANIKAATADFDARGQAYNIGCGVSQTLIELVDTINEILETDLSPEFGPPRVGDIRMSMSDISRARQDFGFDPSVAFKEGLRRTIEWYRESM